MSSTNSNKVVEKASGIIAAIEKCGCTHCIALLKNGLREPTPNPDDDADTNSSFGKQRDDDIP